MSYENKYNKYQIKYLKKLEQFGGKNNYKFIESIVNGYNVIDKLGVGFHGTTFLVEDKKTKERYAMKIENILKEHMDENYKSPYMREIDFAKTMGTKYPNQFMKIYKYENKKCRYKHFISPVRREKFTPEQESEFKKLINSGYCSIKFFSLVDNILEKIIYNLDKNVIYDLFIQLVYIAYLINKEGYLHGDFQPGNVGFIKTNDKFIKIFDKNIPTHGYLLQAIDYGSVLHPKYDLNDVEKNRLKYHNDLVRNYRIIFKLMLKNLREKHTDIDIYKPVDITENQNEILKSYLKNIIKDDTTTEKNFYANLEKILYKIMFFDEYQSQLNIKDKVKLFDFMSIETLQFMILNYHDIEKILRHLIEKY